MKIDTGVIDKNSFTDTLLKRAVLKRKKKHYRQLQNKETVMNMWVFSYMRDVNSIII